MKLIFSIILIMSFVFVNAQHQHSTIAPKKTTTTKQPSVTQKKDTAHSHTHIVDDSILVVHDKDHNELREEKIKKDTVPQKSHTHEVNDSVRVVHDQHHNELREEKIRKDSLAKSAHTHEVNDSVRVVHDQHHNEIREEKISRDTIPAHQQHGNMPSTDHSGHEAGHEANMSHAFSKNLPMNRNGSGTGWLPDASPMYGYMFHTPKWMYMLHGNLFLRYNNQDFTNKGSRGAEEFDAPNWLMFMGQRNFGNKGLFHFNTMFSLDAAVAGGSGYPLLFQSGELYKGQPLVDRQHPHDLFSELSVSYSHAFSKKTDLFLYLAYPGEPALGPVAFMHRPSSLSNPDAPISHHWIDATHITFGVATLGLRSGNFKLEASSFTGREPDEDRYDFDEPKFDSWSARLSYNPTSNWALQVSHGFLNDPEIIHPGEDVNRTTASAIYSKQLAKGNVNAAFVWGMNKKKGHEGENAFLAEGSWKRNRISLFSKYEFVQKSAEELVLDEDIYGHDAIFPVHAFTAGLNYDLLKFGKTNLAAGAHFTFYNADKKLDQLYGKNPMAFEFYVRLYPQLMR